MNGHNPYAQYRQTSVETATPTRLVVMLYDGALRFLNQAMPALRARDLEAQSRYISKAQAIIAQLRANLDFQAGGEVAYTLQRFYITAYDSLTQANINDDARKLQTVIDGLRELREAWVEVDKQCQMRKAAPELMAA